MKDSNSLHQKVQEHIDCFAGTDPLREMSVIKDDTDIDEASMKWLALTVLHGINNNAEKIVISRDKDGQTKVIAEYRPTELPSPGPVVGENVIQAVKEMLHIGNGQNKSRLAMGIRDSSIELNIKCKVKDNREKLTIGFPKVK